MEGTPGEGEEEAGDQRKGDQKGSPTSGADVPIGVLRSGVCNTRNRIKYGRSCGGPPQEGRREVQWGLILNISSHDKNEETYKG